MNCRAPFHKQKQWKLCSSFAGLVALCQNVPCFLKRILEPQGVVGGGAQGGNPGL